MFLSAVGRRVRNFRSCSGLPSEIVKNSKGDTFKLQKTNAKFEEYYKRFFLTDESWEEALQSMREPLPVAFRLTSYSPQRYLLSLLEKEFGALIHQVPWYKPFGHALQVQSLHRWNLESSQSLHRFIIRERELGHLYRQELVSMVPVHFLDIQPDHCVLDMCASPGSKTTQALEYLTGDGFIIANEFHKKRVEKLIRNLHHFSTSNAHLTVCEDGRYFPEILLDNNSSVLRYDRIICDVPCSGDGTIRKNPNVWLNWHPVRANERHHLQYAIALRGIELLKPGGIMVYSSCAMNPVENEAVISRILRDFKGSVHVKDPPPQSTGLNYSRGLTNWQVFDKNMNCYSDCSSAVNNVQISPYLFPPREDWIQSELMKTMRFQPHHNDDGGFYVAYIQKKRDAPDHSSSQKKFPNYDCKNKLLPKAIQTNFPELKKSLDFFGIDHSSTSTMFNYSNQCHFKKIRSTSKELLDLCLRNPSLNIIGLGDVVLKKESKASSPIEFTFPTSFSRNPLQSQIKSGSLDISLNEFQRLIELEHLKSSEFPSAKIGPVLFIVKNNQGDIVETCLGYVGKEKISLNISLPMREHLRLKYTDP